MPSSTDSSRQAFSDSHVRAVFRTYPPEVRSRLLELRRLIFATAVETRDAGKLQETLKWGQPSYLTAESGSGTTIRIDRIRNEPGKYALFVHCQTNLLATFREFYPQTFEYRGNRCIVLDAGRRPPVSALRHCIAFALTYHLRKKQKPGVSPAARASARSGRRVRPSP